MVGHRVGLQKKKLGFWLAEGRLWTRGRQHAAGGRSSNFINREGLLTEGDRFIFRVITRRCVS